MSIINQKRVVIFAFLWLALANSIICMAQSNPDVPEYLRDIVSRTNLDAPLTDNQLASILPMVSDAIIKINGLDSSSKEADYVRNLVLTRKPADAPQRPGDKAPIAHYRFREGFDLPSKEALEEEQNKAKFILAKQKLNEKIRDAIPKALNAGPKKKEEATKVISKPTCQSSSSANLTIPKGYLAEGQAMDILFFEGKPPFDVKTVIGKNTNVISFGDQSTAAKASPFASMDIDCVPFRIRSTGSKVTYSKGALALKNYDADPSANGTFDPTIKKYIEQNNLGGGL